jgi:hypothetical protein
MSGFELLTTEEVEAFRRSERIAAEATQRGIEAGILMAALTLLRTTAGAVGELAARAGHDDIADRLAKALKRNDSDLIDAATPPETGDDL